VHLFFERGHKLEDHLIELHDFFFHGVIQPQGVINLLLKCGYFYVFSLDDMHEFIDNVIGHVNNFLLK
jgi:hypothetical protein